MSDETHLARLGRLVDGLESSDAFERRDAIEQLALLTQQRLDYRWLGSETDRAEAVGRWRTWIGKQRSKLRGRQVSTTIQILSGGKIDQKALKKTLESLPDKQAQQLIAHVMSKLKSVATAGMHPVCEDCGERPATVRITERDAEGAYAQIQLCEVCNGALEA